jgi:hypothetical protein
MKVYIASLVDLENTVIVGVYSSEDVAISKVEKAMDELYLDNEDLGVYPTIIEKFIDDIEEENYI